VTQSPARLAAVLLLVPLAATCGDARDRMASDDAAAGAAPPAEAPAGAGAGEPILVDGHLRAFVDSVRSQESRRLAGVPTVERASLTRLVVRPAEAPAITLDDELAGGDLMQMHIFRGRLLDRFVVLEVIFYEGGEFMLIDERTGAVHDIDAMPAASPDGARFVTTSLDLVAGHQPNRIAVHRVTADGIVEEWADEPRDRGPSHAEWLDARTIRYRVNTIDTSVEPHAVSQSVAWLDLAPSGWRVRR
jgi:hypothetical protein